MKVTRIIGLLTLAASLSLAACGGGGVPTTTLPAAAPTSTASAYTGPAPATADVQAFEVNFWNNVRVQNRCGQCHNATTPAQMPNFARSDNVNLAYAQANTVVNLANPATSMIVTKVSGGHNCWLADNNACGTILTTWISNWAGATGAASATTVQLTAPPVQSVGQSLNFPAAGTDYQNTVYTLTSKYCVRCHSSTAGATQQSPFFADPQIATAYPAAIPKIDFTGCIPFNATTCGTNSRFYQRLLTDNHNCWTDCASDAALMLGQIQAFAQMLTPTNIDPTLVISKALGLSQGTIASGASRYDADTIAKYEFQTGTGTVAYDTSGIDPSADLTITGNVTWAGGWGINVGAGGKAQATTASSSKLFTLIQATGEFSVEAWVAPALVAVDKSYMVSYSGGDTTRNFTLGQTNQDYDFMLRSSNSDLNGMMQLQTPTAAMLLQASLQHVVLTYDPVNGRQIYVNGVNANVPDAQKGGTISNWDNTFALVLGNETSGDRSWQGLIKFVAVHSRAMSAAQVMQNYNAGVGERYYMLFNVAGCDGRVPGLRDVHREPVRQLRLPVLSADVHLARSDGQTDQHSRQGHSHRHQRYDPEGRAGLHPAQHDGHRGELHGAGRGVVEHRHGHRPGERPPRGSVLPAIRPARIADERDRRADAGRTSLPVGTGGGRRRRAHLRAGQLDPLGAHRSCEDQRERECHLPGRAAAAAADPDARELLLLEPGRHRAARGPILQRGNGFPLIATKAVPGRDLQRLDFPGEYRNRCK